MLFLILIVCGFFISVGAAAQRCFCVHGCLKTEYSISVPKLLHEAVLAILLAISTVRFARKSSFLSSKILIL